MIRFIVKREHAYTVKSLGTNFGFDTPPCSALAYEDLFDAETIEPATYIFSDIERLSDAELVVAAEIASVMERAANFRVLNHPARVRTRFALLRALYDRGLNAFDAYRADGGPRPQRFPVFVRAEAEHEPALTGLLPDQAALDGALAGLVSGDRPLRGLVVIEYCGAEVRPGIWRRYGTFRLGDAIQLDHIVTEASWNVKWGTQGLSTEKENGAAYLAVLENHFSDPLREVFEVAGIQYGRADFAFVDDRPQIYEINTNPFLGALVEDVSPSRTRYLRLAHERFAASLFRLDSPSLGPSLELHRPRAVHLRGVRAVERERIEAVLRPAPEPPSEKPAGEDRPNLEPNGSAETPSKARATRARIGVLVRVGARILGLRRPGR